MKVKKITAVALCARLAAAVPHRANHLGLHAKRDLTTTYTTVTDVVTVTDYDAVVWVDHAGNIVRTETMTSGAPTTSVGSSTSSLISNNTVEATSATTLALTSTGVTTDASDRIAPATSTGSPATNTNLPPSTSTTPELSATITPSSSVSSVSSSAVPIPAPSSSSTPATNGGSTGSSHGGTIPGFGMAYDAWNGNGCRPDLDSEFSFMASQGASKIRVYDVCFSQSINAAVAHGLKLMIGITSFAGFDTSFNSLISEVTSTQAGWSVVDTVFVGNELVNDGLASSQAVADKVSYARGILKTKGYTGNVVTVDTWVKMRDDSVICSTSDYCAANAYAFFDGNVLPANAGAFVRKAYNAVAAGNNGKHVVITESGWPHAGSPQGVSVANIDNQRTAMQSIINEFMGDPADMYLFQGYDATYKSSQPEVERNFGIFGSSYYDGTI